MASAYTANLASFLVAEDAPAYTSITLEEAYQTKTPVCAREGAAVHNELQRKYPGMHLVTAPSFVETYARLRNGDCFVMATRASDWSKFERDARVNTNDCGLKWIGRAESINGGGAATKIDIGEYCTSLVMHVLDIFFNEMHSDGFIQEAWNAHVESVATNDCSADSAHSNSEEEDGSLRPVDVGGIFVTHGIASFLAIAVALFERQCRKKKKKNGRNNKDQLDDLNIERGEVLASSIEAITMEKVSCGRINRSTGTKREIICDTSLPSDFQGEQEEMLIKEAMVTLQKLLLCRRNDTLQTERCSETEEV
eukprot:CAMPEP_0202451064 /NCGR_PEP_ID=MMETSP1360-20130828/9569_1 /ASSEMBLY_ACC=CAM_ASM_000848 /TAXON_ID=515479 /ORGANISM="Licmophora paradoxa, Strain CCMP2313" /LENGTH=309 /DNA_ID=CAMNT_0049069531 /DNA_START=33 /DNA_END=962 /DNA_ORIENTATION=-